MLDDDGYLTITDRKADVIIRGGENISALEVEEVLLAMPRRRRGRGGGGPGRAARRARGGGAAAQAGQPMPTLEEVRDALRARPAWPGRSGRRNCTKSTTFRAPRAARCRSSSGRAQNIALSTSD